MKKTYGGITFAEGYNKTFAEFKDDFASTHVFNAIPSAQREAELKKAYKIATSGNGNISATVIESKEADSQKSA
jgi:hypothetical protein